MFSIRENEIADALTTADIWRIMLEKFPRLPQNTLSVARTN